jgi:hypothetical protein
LNLFQLPDRHLLSASPVSRHCSKRHVLNIQYQAPAQVRVRVRVATPETQLTSSTSPTSLRPLPREHDDVTCPAEIASPPATTGDKSYLVPAFRTLARGIHLLTLRFNSFESCLFRVFIRCGFVNWSSELAAMPDADLIRADRRRSPGCSTHRAAQRRRQAGSLSGLQVRSL